MNTKLEEIDVAHICLFERWTWRVLIQHNNRFNKKSFVWWKCDWKSTIETIKSEMWDEIWYCLFPSFLLEAIKNTIIVL